MRRFQKLTEEIMLIHKQRNHEIVSKQTTVAGLRENAYEDLRLVINAISMAYSKASDEDKEELAKLSSEINDNLRTFRTKLLSRRTKSRNKREQKVAIEELINNSKTPEAEKSNLPMVIYNKLQISDEHEKSTVNNSEQTTSKSIPTQKPGEKTIGVIGEKIIKPSTRKGLSNLSPTKKDKKKGGNGKLPPTSSN